MAKTYTVRANGERPLFVLGDREQVSYSCWRDLGRICGKSWDEGGKMVFECLLPERAPEAQKTLKAYGWEREDGRDPVFRVISEEWTQG
jgi:hypothetical protein